MRPLFLASALCLSACSTPADPLVERWELIWEDEFDGSAGSAIDDANWDFDVGGDGWGNQQLEYDTDRTDNVSLDGDGNLQILAKRESYEGRNWTSGRIKTKGKFEFTYGRVEARIKVPEGTGFWPAFWMLGANIDEVSWPTCGEIDILEARGNEPRTVLGTVHGPGYAGGDSVGASLVGEDKFTDDFHVYAIEWDPQHIIWYVDGEVLNTVHPGDLPGGAPWVFNHDFFLILNLAVGGVFLDNPDETTPDQGALLVDYVRVYERAQPLTDPLP